MDNQTLPCPYCGRSLVVIPESVVVAVRSLDQRGRSSTTFWDPSRLSSQARLASGASFEQVATPLFPAGRQEVVSGDQRLQPGEKMISKTYRERSASDIKYPLITNLVSTGIIGVSALGICLSIRLTGLRSAIFGYNWRSIVQYWPVVPPAAMLATMAWLWFKRQLPDLLDDDRLIAAVQEHERRPEPTPIEIKPPSVEVIVPQAGGDGYQDKRAVLTAPKADHSGLWRYCRALALDQAFPSWEGGKDKPGARAFGFTESELDTFRVWCVKAGLMAKPTKKNQPWTITGDGIRSFHEIARSRAQEWEASYAVT